MELSHQVFDLKLALPWATARTTEPGGLRRSQVVQVTLRDAASGIVGFGEAAPINRYGESTATVQAFLSSFDASRLSLDQLDESLALIAGEGSGEMAAKCAIEMALYDAAGKRAGQPVWELLNLGPPGVRAISYTIGIGPAERIQEQVRRAADFQLLKLKLGGPHDQESFRALREVAPDKRVCVDANEGWPDREHALRMIEWLATDGRIEFVEQPLPAGHPEADHRWLFERSPLPLFADESCHRSDEVARLAGSFHGINVKLMKTGGLTRALAALRQARQSGLQTMLGCMIESSLGIAAAFQLAALADHLDLDSHVLLVNDPSAGLRTEGGAISWAADERVPGLGVQPQKA